MSDLTPTERAALRSTCERARGGPVAVLNVELRALLDRADDADRLEELVRVFAGGPWRVEVKDPDLADLLARVLEGDDRG